jgi:hypothetical protein
MHGYINSAVAAVGGAFDPNTHRMALWDSTGTTFDLYAGTGNKLSYFTSTGKFVRSTIDPDSLITQTDLDSITNFSIENVGSVGADSALIRVNSITLGIKSDSLYSADSSILITKNHDTNNRRYNFISGIRTLSSQYTNVGNVGTGEDDLMSYVVPASTLIANGDRLEIDAEYTFAANANSKTIKFKFGANSIDYASGVTSSGGGLSVHITFIRTGTNTQRVTIVFRPASGTFDTRTLDYALTSASSLTIKTTGTATADNDIVQNTLNVTYYKAP